MAAVKLNQSLTPPASQASVRNLELEHLFSGKPSKETSPYTVNDLLVQKALCAPEAPLLAYPGSQNGRDDYIHYTARNIDQFVDEAARIYLSMGLLVKTNNKDDEVVAILAPANLDYVITMFALSRLGYSLLLLSNRLPTAAYVSLLQSTQCHRIVSTPNYQKYVTAAQINWNLDSFIMVPRDAYDLPQPSGPYFFRAFHGPSESESTAFIIHSSGSTGLPKPIYQSHKSALTNYSSVLGYRAFLTLPLYHNHGLSCFFRSIYSGSEIAFLNSNLPMTSSNLITAMEKVKPEGFHGVPYALKLLGENRRGVELLRKCQVVMFGGSSCPDDLGDRLVKEGVNLVAHYGATEIGQIMTSFRPRNDNAWNYLRPIAGREKYMQFIPHGQETYELVILDGLPSKVVSNSDNPPRSFYTSDTWMPHPTIPNAWKYLGRIDDRITLINGEKCLPIPFEHRVRENDLVKECWMFGIGRALPGIMIVPSENSASLTKKDILDNIWPSVESANARVEGFSQVSKLMVEVLPVETEYPSTDKGTMIRARTYKEYASQINLVYERFEKGLAGEDIRRLVLDVQGLQNYLLDAFRHTIGISGVNIDTDLFAAGVDSLQAISVWGMIKREIDLGSGELRQNVVFEYPCIRDIAAHLYALRGGGAGETTNELAIMANLVEKYSHFPQHKPCIQGVESESIILTGATGSLGAHVLSQLITKKNVEVIYCLVRASSQSAALDRILKALSSKNISPVNADKIICLPADLSLPDLGLPSGTISVIRSKLTKIIHCAWAVNFNLGVSSFESQHIRGAYNLLLLCLSVHTPNPAAFYFCSSISAAAGTPLPATITETYITQLENAQNMGYARSKLAVENIVKAAVEKTGITARVCRIGQIVGDSRIGIWNSIEAIPLMIRSATTLGVLPDLDETPSWLPCDLVAKSILEISGLEASGTNSTVPSSDSSIVYHIQNTQMFHWARDLLPALRTAGLSFCTVSKREWVDVLRKSNLDPIQNPTIKLLDFFAEKYDNDGPGRKDLVFVTEETAKASPTVAEGYDVIGSGIVEMMVQRWFKEWSAR